MWSVLLYFIQADFHYFMYMCNSYIYVYSYNIYISMCIYIHTHKNYLVMSDSLWPHGLQHARLPCPSPTPRAYSNSCPLSRWCHPTISSSVSPFSSHLQSFSTSQLFASGGQSIGVSASASVLPMNIQDWFPLGWTGLISLHSKGFSRVFSNTTVQKLQFFGAQFSLWSTLTSIHDYWKNHCFDETDLCWQSNVSAF